MVRNNKSLQNSDLITIFAHVVHSIWQLAHSLAILWQPPTIPARGQNAVQLVTGTSCTVFIFAIALFSFVPIYLHSLSLHRHFTEMCLDSQLSLLHPFVLVWVFPRVIIAAYAWNLPSMTCLISRLFFHALIRQEAELSFFRADHWRFLSFIYAWSVQE